MSVIAQAPSLSAQRGRDTATAIDVLRQRFGERLQTGEAIRQQHAHTLTWIANQPPDAVIFVETAADVSDVVRVARQYRAPIIPFGAGTSLEGHVNAPEGGLSLDFSRMNKIIAVNERDLDCVVEPGVSRKQLNDYLRDRGVFFPVDPGAEWATIGGMAATRASGTNAVRYGTMRENVLNVTAVMADGSIVKTGQRARKSSAGYDLTRLLVGSEGTLGIFTELTVRLCREVDHGDSRHGTRKAAARSLMVERPFQSTMSMRLTLKRVESQSVMRTLCPQSWKFIPQ